jgi:hypothetical protein
MSEPNSGDEVEPGAVEAHRLPPPANGDSAAADGDIRAILPDAEARGLDAEATGAASVPPLESLEIGSSLAALALWLVLLSAGLSVSTQPYIDTIQDQQAASPWAVVKALFIIATCHTVTNTALLCCLAAFLGALGFRVLGVKTGAADGLDRRDAYVAAATRGFYVFLIVQSGSIMLSDQAFTNLTLEKYIRLAGLSSLLSFTVGYNPALFRQLMERVDRNFTSDAASTRPT